MNKPFDQRVINQLERPTSSDLNIAQSQLNSNQRALMRYLLQTPEGTTQGAIGNSFKVSPGFGRRVNVAPGIISTNLITDEYLNIGAITGLNDVYPQRTILLSAVKQIVVPDAPGAGLCRRDVIAVRPLLDTEMLFIPDVQNTDIYDPGINAFSVQAVNKTLTSDISSQIVQVINYDETPTAPIVYIKGQESAYSELLPDLLLSAPAPLLLSASGYTNIAILNIVPEHTDILESDIVDYRRIAAPTGNLTLTGKATIGWDTTPGGELSDVVIKAPAGVRASIYKAGAYAGSGDETNTYILAVFGARNVSSADISITPGIPGPEGLASSAWTIRPTQIMTGAITLSAGSTYAAQQNYADAAKAAPTQDVAIGQPVHFFPFTLGTIETGVTTGTTTVTTPVINSDPGEIVIGAAGSSYPGGSYPLQNVNNFAPPLYGSTTAYTPIVYPMLPGATYQLGTALPTGAPVTISGVLADAYTWTPVVVFVTAEGWQNDFQYVDGVWRFSMYISAVNPNFSRPAVQARVRLGRFDGSTLLELATSGEVTVPVGYADQLGEVVFSIPVAGIIPTTDQLTLGIELYNVFGTATDYAVSWGNTHFARLDTPLLLDPAIVTIPNPPSAYPAGTYSVINADPGEVAVTVPTLAVSTTTRFNPKASIFQSSSFDDYPTVPITFTVNLSLN